MGTRNLTKVIKDGKAIVAQYGQWDGYPEGQGTTLFYTLQSQEVVDAFINKIPQIYYPTQDELEALVKPFEDGSMAGMMTMDSGKKFAEVFPTLTRDTCAEIVRVIADYDKRPIPISLDEEFENDTLFCEGVYEVNLDNNTFTSKYGRFWEGDKKGEWQFVITLTFDELRSMPVEEYHNRFRETVDA